jgi:hypothetical protein
MNFWKHENFHFYFLQIWYLVFFCGAESHQPMFTGLSATLYEYTKCSRSYQPLGTEQLTCNVKGLLRHPVYPITQCRYLQCCWYIQLFSLTLSCYILSLSLCYYVYYLRCLHGLHFRQVKHFCLSFGHGHTPTVDVAGTQTRVCMFKAVAESRHLTVYRCRRI